jgi:hypothetical protein
VSNIFIAVGKVDYEFEKIIGIARSFGDAAGHVGTAESKRDYPFDRFYVQEWVPGGSKPVAVWTKQAAEIAWREMS